MLVLFVATAKIFVVKVRTFNDSLTALFVPAIGTLAEVDFFAN
jgi:hypothetical protein